MLMNVIMIFFFEFWCFTFAKKVLRDKNEWIFTPFVFRLFKYFRKAVKLAKDIWVVSDLVQGKHSVS